MPRARRALSLARALRRREEEHQRCGAQALAGDQGRAGQARLGCAARRGFCGCPSVRRATLTTRHAEWTIEIDWETIGKLTEGSSYRENAGKNVIENYVVELVANDISKFDADDAGAINKLTGLGAKKFLITMAAAGGSFAISSREWRVDLVLLFLLFF